MNKSLFYALLYPEYLLYNLFWILMKFISGLQSKFNHSKAQFIFDNWNMIMCNKSLLKILGLHDNLLRLSYECVVMTDQIRSNESLAFIDLSL